MDNQLTNKGRECDGGEITSQVEILEEDEVEKVDLKVIAKVYEGPIFNRGHGEYSVLLGEDVKKIEDLFILNEKGDVVEVEEDIVAAEITKIIIDFSKFCK